MARASFLYRLLDLDLLEGLDTTRAQFFGKGDDLSFSRGNEDVNARSPAPALSVSLKRGSYQRVARRMNGAGVYQLG